jgi:peptidoglycan/xylan/chitin deacetylase (PgdA/CDA1 family)
VFASLRGEGPPLRRAIAFTIDDGYREHAVLSGSLFAEFDCPATVFVTTGFLDGSVWFWWDQIEYLLAAAERKTFQFDWATARSVYDCRDPVSTFAAVEDFTARCKLLSPQDKHDAIRRLSAVVDAALPASAPAGYEPMTWDQLRAAEALGMTFAPHTVTHPILSRADDRHAENEIVRSWQRLKQEARKPVPIFAYPNGRPGDFGAREFDVLRRAQLQGAVTSMAGFATPKHFRAPNGHFLVPRLPFPDSLPYLIQLVSGLERLKYMLRGVA